MPILDHSKQVKAIFFFLVSVRHKRALHTQRKAKYNQSGTQGALGGKALPLEKLPTVTEASHLDASGKRHVLFLSLCPLLTWADDLGRSSAVNKISIISNELKDGAVIEERGGT